MFGIAQLAQNAVGASGMVGDRNELFLSAMV